MKVQNTSKNTKLAIETIDSIENPESKGIKQSKEEEKIV
jgi:hypothetical protein